MGAVDLMRLALKLYQNSSTGLRAVQGKMANENMEEYRTGPAIIDETVRVAKKYLEEHPEESPLPLRGAVAGREIVASFLNWPESRVGYSLERLNLEKSGMVNREASFLLSLILRWPFHDAATGIF